MKMFLGWCWLAALKKRGHEVVAVENGRRAWEAFQQDYFPVLISDWLMPEMDGLALCRKIRNLPRENYTYLVLLTSLEGGKSGGQPFDGLLPK